jgi:CheY-like chemotaxis protein
MGVAEATLDMLEQMGCATVHVQSGEEAVAVFERARAVDPQAQPFDVLLIDLTVRGATGGRACLAKLRKTGCVATAVLTSGYAHLVDVAAWREDGFDAVLPKPYSLDELRHTLEVSVEEPEVSLAARSGT